MNISRFEPWSLVNVLHRNPDHIAALRFGLAGGELSGQTVTDWVPAVDIVEEKTRFVLRADVPGVKPEDIDVSMENGVLSVSGQRSDESTGETSDMQRTERNFGKFCRRFSLPDSADGSEISARSDLGTLEVIVPKLPQVTARRIVVKPA